MSTTLLTARERETVLSYGRTHSYRQTAAMLGITVATVKAHLASARLKLRATDTWEAVEMVRRISLQG